MLCLIELSCMVDILYVYGIYRKSINILDIIMRHVAWSRLDSIFNPPEAVVAAAGTVVAEAVIIKKKHKQISWLSL